jgi:hypothetical protein
MSKRRKIVTASSLSLDDETLAQFEQLSAQVATLQEMSNENLLTDDELDRFFALVLPAQHAALDAERAAAGRSLTQAEFQVVSVKAFVSAAGNAAREVWGATIGELIDGRKPQ